jgi:outer membrane protein assembly factor BamB
MDIHPVLASHRSHTPEADEMMGRATGRLVRRLLVVIALGVLVPGASFGQSPSPPTGTMLGEWPMFKGDAARRGEGVGGPRGAPRLRWRFQAQGAVTGNVSVASGFAYASSDDGVLHALDLLTGDERWSFAADQPPLSGPVLDSGSIYVFDGSGVLHAIDAANGAELWRTALPVAGPSSATVGAGAVYVGSADGGLVAIDQSDGSERWHVPISTTGGQAHSPAFADGRVYVAAEGGGFVAVHASDGSIVWRFDTEGFTTATAVVADGLAYVGADADAATGRLWAIDATTGSEVWRIEQAIFSPALADGIAYAGSAGPGVFAIDVSTGSVRWTFAVDGKARPLAVADGVAYVPADAEQRVYALDASTGAARWHFDVDSGMECCIAVAQGAVYVGTFLGGVYAIEGDAAMALQ